MSKVYTIGQTKCLRNQLRRVGIFTNCRCVCSLISSSPPLTKSFFRRKTLNDFLSFHPFLQEDYQQPLFLPTVKGKRFVFYIVGISTQRIKLGVASHVMQSQTIFKMKFEDFLIMVSPNLLDLGYLKKTLLQTTPF